MRTHRVYLHTYNQAEVVAFLTTLLDFEVIVGQTPTTLTAHGIYFQLIPTKGRPPKRERLFFEFDLDSVEEVEDFAKRANFYFYRGEEARATEKITLQKDSQGFFCDIIDPDSRVWRLSHGR